MPVTRTSLPGGAVVARSNRCRASRLAGAPRSSAARSTPGRHVEAKTVGSANTTSSASAGWIDTSSATVTPSRKIQPHVENSDMYMWSSTNTWSRSTDRRSRYSGRSWCSIVATEASSCATCDSSAMVSRSRNRRWVRSLMTRRNQVAAAAAPARSRDQHAAARSCQHAVGEQLEQKRDERVGQRPTAATGQTPRSGALARPGTPA